MFPSDDKTQKSRERKFQQGQMQILAREQRGKGVGQAAGINEASVSRPAVQLLDSLPIPAGECTSQEQSKIGV